MEAHHSTDYGSNRESSEDSSIENYGCAIYCFEPNLSLKSFQHTSACTETKENLQSVSSLQENATYNSDFKQTDEVDWFYCAECSFKGKLKKHLVRHIWDSHSTKRHECDKCSFKCKRKMNLTLHINNVHLNDKDVKWRKCNECAFKTKYGVSLKRHVNGNHLDDTKIKWYKCHNCSFRTKRAENLKRHEISIHLNDEEIKWYKCEDCSYKSKRNSNLKRHVKIHLKIK
ncbi:hypothetical protein Zmor_017414 [Zophobas morio]|uniref:C2H2-type domain-containing protein n=1 Tax=Zophobas morio TaxID=2755281 RepID=A0AA38MC40_9CUCU|nr:hypothetical protein Zmor_017414 [Zophobas morio]